MRELPRDDCWSGAAENGNKGLIAAQVRYRFLGAEMPPMNCDRNYLASELM